MNPQEVDAKQTIDDLIRNQCTIIGHGKPQHGMNGKDSDLGRIGQCTVTQLETIDTIGAKEMRVDIHLRLYASVCAPS
jgi:hypothetical protein